VNEQTEYFSNCLAALMLVSIVALFEIRWSPNIYKTRFIGRNNFIIGQLITLRKKRQAFWHTSTSAGLTQAKQASVYK